MTMYSQDIYDEPMLKVIDRKDTHHGQLNELKRALPRWFSDELGLDVYDIAYESDFLSPATLIVVTDSWNIKFSNNACSSLSLAHVNRIKNKFLHLFEFVQIGIRRTGIDDSPSYWPVVKIKLSYVVDPNRFSDISEALAWAKLSDSDSFETIYHSIKK